MRCLAACTARAAELGEVDRHLPCTSPTWNSGPRSALPRARSRGSDPRPLDDGLEQDDLDLALVARRSRPRPARSGRTSSPGRHECRPAAARAVRCDRAAWCSSARESRLSISADPIIRVPSCPLASRNDQPRLRDLGQRNAMFGAASPRASRATDSPAGRPHADDLRLRAVRRARRQHLRRASRRSAAIAGVRSGRSTPATTPPARSRSPTSPIASSRASSARETRAQSSTVTCCAVAPVDADLEQRAPCRAALPELDEVEAEPVNLVLDNSFQRLVHVVSRYVPRTKKCGEPPPHSSSPDASRGQQSTR